MMFSRPPRMNTTGFTLVELVMIMLLVGIISVAVVVKYPSNMDRRAAVLEFRQAVRSAQQMAMSRTWTTSSAAWGIQVAGNHYYVGRANVNCQSDCNQVGCAEELLCNRPLTGDATMALTPVGATSAIYFNGLGEPINSAGTLLPSVSFQIDGAQAVTVCAETGYVMEAATCP